MPLLTEIQSAQIVALLEAGLIQSAVAIRMGINRSTVSRVFSRYQETDSSARPTRVARQVGNEALSGRRISTQTIRRRLHKRGLRSQFVLECPC
ncbi:hypothetical protein ALC57_13325 [Trachymyrmex cornetzi]|uniref:Transposase IS30-like HTH domain-containing protein n=1 Tax=Trachymyrmex cornetzi TaxID=471704 RepID=A0A151IZK4_9HYME|nr:hypothetical protein ALC57_13325 [Trachymyrmex cornetzi]